MAEDRTFVPTIVLGLAAAGLTAVAGNKPMLVIPEEVIREFLVQQQADTFPEVGSLALVLLALWGVLLVTRGRVRKVVAVSCPALVIGILGAIVYRGLTLDDNDYQVLTGWFWVSGAGALVSLFAGVAAARFASSWPEMGQRYDAPASGAAAPRAGDAVPPEERASIDLWKSLDEGDDPTAH